MEKNLQNPPIENSEPADKSTTVRVRERSRRKFFVVLIVLSFVVVLFTAGWLLLQTNTISSPAGTPSSQIPEQTSKTTVEKNSVLLKLGVGYTVNIHTSWDVKIIEVGDKHNFLTAKANTSGIRIEIEAFSHTFPNWEKYLRNNIYRIEKTESKRINNNTVKIETGKESFAQSNATLVIGTWDNQDKTLVVRMIGNNQNAVTSLFEQFSSTVSDSTTPKRSSGFIREAYAAETNESENLPPLEYKEIEVMEEPLDDEITSKDPPYKDGYAKGYKFLAFKSQKLASYAEENRESNPNSFIHTQIFDSNGAAISLEMDTHVEFKAPYTGEYFLVVWTFGKQEGKATVRIDDNDQLGCSSIIKYPDGAELAMNPEERAAGGDIIVGAFDVGYIYQCPRPITVINNELVQTESVPRRKGEAPKTISWQMNLWISADLYKPKEGTESTFIPSEDSYGNKTEFKIEQLNANRILITPKDGLFPKDKQANIRGWGTRFFTQAKFVVPDIPILKGILEEFPDEFQPKQTYDYTAIEPRYFDWSDETGGKNEVYGGMLWYRSWIPSDHEGKSLLEKYRQYFIDKGYVVNEKNTYQGESAKGVGRTKEVVGLELGQTVCKVIYDASSFNIYCGIR